MTEEGIDKLHAGRELDALITEKVMGRRVPSQEEMRAVAEADWLRNPRQQFFDGSSALPPFGAFKAAPRDAEAAKQPFSHDLAVFEINCPNYSTDIASAWKVVEKMEALGFWCQTQTPFGAIASLAAYDGYWAGFTPHGTTGWNGTPDHWTCAETLALAICMAALKTVAAMKKTTAP